jgi:hypothetical protein
MKFAPRPSRWTQVALVFVHVMTVVSLLVATAPVVTAQETLEPPTAALETPDTEDEATAEL